MNNEIAKRYRLCSNCSDRILSGGCDGKCKEYWKYVGAKEQQAIDEEVRLKKSNAMTGKQLDREECFASWYFQNVKGAPTFSDAIEWSRKQTIEEVCEWMMNFKIGSGEFPLYNYVGNFRKAMEE